MPAAGFGPASAERRRDINADLEGTAHYGGPANVDEDGNYYLMDAEGYLWSGSKLQDETSLESEGYL